MDTDQSPARSLVSYLGLRQRQTGSRDRRSYRAMLLEMGENLGNQWGEMVSYHHHIIIISSSTLLFLLAYCIRGFRKPAQARSPKAPQCPLLQIFFLLRRDYGENPWDGLEKPRMQYAARRKRRRDERDERMRVDERPPAILRSAA